MNGSDRTIMKENNKSGRLLGESLRFLVTGGVCFFIEFLVYLLLTRLLRTDTLLATAVAFCISVTFNWVLCLKWVFPEAGRQNRATGIGFLITSVIGLLVNELLMLIFRFIFGETAFLLELGTFRVTMDLVNKCLATLLVTVWNFFTKRAILTSDRVKRLAERFRK